VNRRRVTITLSVAVVLIAGSVALLRHPRHAPPLVVEEWISAPPQTAGKLLMLEFWATWCGPCVAAIPEGNRLQERFRDDLVVIAISDEPAQVIRGHDRPAITYTSAVDTQARMARALGVRGIPATFIIDPEGIIRWSGDPFLDHNHQRNQQMWDDLMSDLIAKYGGKPEPSATGDS
jgi:cytochrome c biogenesis protein CcmG, thiol:disulfide interchange protein DsbE